LLESRSIYTEQPYAKTGAQHFTEYSKTYGESAVNFSGFSVQDTEHRK
jgi:hypothetical protein